MKRGQGTFEYVLLLGGVLLIVVLAIVVLQNTASSGFKGVEQTTCASDHMLELKCKSGFNWNSCGVIPAEYFAPGGKYVKCTSVGVTTKPTGTGCDTAPALQTKTIDGKSYSEKYCGEAPIK
ncbi:class III signal peptide-containing protein [Candidatus Micrarchaeota archaeon]|nr:class III signal peptide-containing protein [Candidatus Micrarchaeota archaeon]